MFKPFPIKNSHRAAKYFTAEDNYYLSEVESKDMSSWLGEGAKRLGITGKVNEELLQTLFEGKLPNGAVIQGAKQNDGSIKHRPGFDLQFSAPKSLSILVLDGGDQRLYQAHLKAVEKTLKTIEHDCAQAKIYKNGEISYENTKNLIIARIGHTASRKLDAHIHDHALIMNATQRSDGKWRALASSKNKNNELNGFAERVYENQLYYGVIYRSYLAHQVKEFGYNIENVGPHGLWEIKGIPKNALDAMSKRRFEILEAERKFQYSTCKVRDVIAQKTKEKKPSHLDVNNLKQGWQEELAAVGFSSKKFIENTSKNADKVPRKSNTATANNLAKESVLDAIQYWSQYKLQLSYEKIIEKALEFTMGSTTHVDIIRAVNNSIQEKKLISLDKNQSLFVTHELLQTEKNIRELVDRGIHLAQPVKIKDKVRAELDTSKPSVRLAIDVLQSKDRLHLVNHMETNTQQFASTIMQISERSGKAVHILAPDNLAVREINQTIKRRPKTLWQWIIAQGKPEIGDSVTGFNYKYKQEMNNSLATYFRKGKDIIIVDGAEGLDNKNTLDLLKNSEQTQARVIFLNDLKAKRGFTTGNPIGVLKQAHINKYLLNPLSERKMAIIPELKTVKDDVKRMNEAVNILINKEDSERFNTLLVMGSKSQLKTAHQTVRKELQHLGKLGENQYTLSVLNPAEMNNIESQYANKYRMGMIVRKYDRTGIKDWHVERIDKEHNILVLKHNKKRIRWNPKTNSGNFRVFRKEELALATGEQIQATAHMNILGIKSAEQFTVQDIKDKHVILAKGNRIQKIPKKSLENMHFDYHYATTLNKIPKKSSKHLIANLKAYALDQLTINHLKQKTNDSLMILTNDKDQALKRFKEIPVKLTATETVLQIGQIDRILDNQSINEIKSDVGKAITVLTTKVDETAAERAVNFALEKLTSKNAGFSHKSLVSEALVHTLEVQLGAKDAVVTRDEVMKVIDAKRKAGELVMGRHFSDGTRWTTQEILQLERSIIANIQSGKNLLEPLMDRKMGMALLKNTHLTQDQKNAALAIATSEHQFIIAQGDAGTGKTTLYMQLREMLKDKVEIYALAPTHQAVRELQERGIKTQTLKSFLIEQHHDHEKLNQKLLVLDEASMVDNKDFSEFISLVKKREGRVVLSGDIAQIIAVGSGKPYEISQRTNSTDIAYLRENLRQQIPILKDSVKEIIEGNYKKAFNKIEQQDPGNYIGRKNSNIFFDTLRESIVDSNFLKKENLTLEQAVADDYLTRTQEVRDKTVVIVHAHQDRQNINELIRAGLKEQGTINQKEEIKISRLVQKGLTDAEHKILHSYAEGDVIKLGKLYYTIITVNPESNSLLLRDEQGKERYFYPDKNTDQYHMEVFQHVHIELAPGDTIRLSKTDKERKHYANFEYTVQDMAKDNLELISKDDHHKINLNPTQLKDNHWDYAYTITGYGVQGSSKDYVIDYELSYRKQLTNQRSFYVAATRAKQHLMIYTDNKEQLLNRIISNTGNKPAALEVVGELNKYIGTTKNQDANRSTEEPIKNSDGVLERDKQISPQINEKQYQGKLNIDDSETDIEKAIAMINKDELQNSKELLEPSSDVMSETDLKKAIKALDNESESLVDLDNKSAAKNAGEANIQQNMQKQLKSTEKEIY